MSRFPLCSCALCSSNKRIGHHTSPKLIWGRNPSFKKYLLLVPRRLEIPNIEFRKQRRAVSWPAPHIWVLITALITTPWGSDFLVYSMRMTMSSLLAFKTVVRFQRLIEQDFLFIPCCYTLPNLCGIFRSISVLQWQELRSRRQGVEVGRASASRQLSIGGWAVSSKVWGPPQVFHLKTDSPNLKLP